MWSPIPLVSRWAWKTSLRQDEESYLWCLIYVYDPLGFEAPFTLPAKTLLQDPCCQNLEWDDPISAEDLTRWRNKFDELPRLESLNVKRCFKSNDFGKVSSTQLHHFADASQRAYGAVTYLRVTNPKGDVHCSLIIGKFRLPQLK